MSVSTINRKNGTVPSTVPSTETKLLPVPQSCGLTQDVFNALPSAAQTALIESDRKLREAQEALAEAKPKGKFRRTDKGLCEMAWGNQRVTWGKSKVVQFRDVLGAMDDNFVNSLSEKPKESKADLKAKVEALQAQIESDESDE